MSKLNLNLNFSWFDVLKHVIRIVAAVGAIFFPAESVAEGFCVHDSRVHAYLCFGEPGR